MSNPQSCLLVHEKGMIAGTLTPTFFDPNAVYAQEMFWWSEGGGPKLLAAFEDWAESLGATGTMVAAEQYADQKKNRQLDRFYARKGYIPKERHFVRTF